MTSDAESDSSCSSPFKLLPDEMVLQILNKLVDLKTLCIRHLISKPFSSIVFQINTIFFTLPYDYVWNHYSPCSVSPCSESFWSSFKFLNKFTNLNSLTIHIPSSNTGCFFRWMIKFSKRIDAFVFLSPNSIYDSNTNKEILLLDNEDHGMDLHGYKLMIALNCFRDAFKRLMLLGLLDLSLLVNVSVTDSGKKGTDSFSGIEIISQVRNCYHPSSESVHRKLSKCYVPWLKLPVSGYVMRGVSMFLMEWEDLPDGDDNIINFDDSVEDKEEAVYREAVLEIFRKHRGSIRMVRASMNHVNSFQQ